jgi:acetylornithine deacetylase/succinyl-diaminopimelate desuccinylase-like protein
MLAHTDTVLADPGEWSVDPWGGELKDDHVWGRGALDMKNQLAASAVAIATLAREGFEPVGDLVFAAVADEEVGEDFGLSWLCREHPDAVRTTYCINEGGGDRTVVGERVFYECGVAEKMCAPFRLRVHGRSGHASMPGIADNALITAARFIDRLGNYRPEPRLLPETELFLEAVLGEVPSAAQALDRVREVDATLAAMVEPMLAVAIAPTMIDASHARNVIPGLVEVVCDCRILPGETPVDIEPLVRAVLGDDGYDLEWIEAVGGTRSSLHTPFWEAIQAFVEEEEPGARVVPMVLSGFTDSHYVREAFGTISYGFFPIRSMESDVAARLVHSADERVAVDDLELGTRFLLHLARTLGA